MKFADASLFELPPTLELDSLGLGDTLPVTT